MSTTASPILKVVLLLAVAASAWALVEPGTEPVRCSRGLYLNLAGGMEGSSLAVSKDLMVVGAPGTNRVCLYRWTGAEWLAEKANSITTELPTSDLTPASTDRFGSSVATNGWLVAVGAPYRVDPLNSSGIKVGVVYLWKRIQTSSGASWAYAGFLVDEKLPANGCFGSSLALTGRTLVVGAGSGRVSVFEWGEKKIGGEGFILQQVLVSPARLSEDFGAAVAISGETILVGAPGYTSTRTDANGNPLYDDFGFPRLAYDSGRVCLYSRREGTWEYDAMVEPVIRPDDPGARFGAAVSLSGSRAVVGAYWDQQQGVRQDVAAGAAYVIVRDINGWVLGTRLQGDPVDADAAADQFGYSVSIHDDLIAVGAPGDAKRDNFGEVYWEISGACFLFNGQGLPLACNKLLPLATDSGDPANPGDPNYPKYGPQAGTAVSVASGLVVVGAPLYVPSGQDDQQRGAVYVYSVNQTESLLQPADAAYGNLFGQSLTQSGHRLAVGAPKADVIAATGVEFVGVDTATLGSWRGVYGQDGYAISCYATSLPTGVTMNVSAPSSGIWSGGTTDARALQKLSPATDRIASIWYQGMGSGMCMDFDIDLGGTGRMVAMYCMDWDGYMGGRTFSIQVIDRTTNAILDTRSCNGLLLTGKWYVWKLSGAVRIKVTWISGGHAVVSGVFFGGPIPPPTGTENLKGKAYVMMRGPLNTDAWTTHYLVPSNLADYDQLGLNQTAIDGNTVVVGAPFHDLPGKADAGAAWVFSWDGSSWVEQQMLTMADAAAGDRFGYSMALRGDRLVIGAPGCDAYGQNDWGAAYAFTRSGTAWTQVQKLIPPIKLRSEGFGTLISMDDTNLLVSAADDPVDINPRFRQTGAVFQYSWDGLQYQVVNRHMPLYINNSTNPSAYQTDQPGLHRRIRFGESAALTNGQAIIGAPGAGYNNSQQPGFLFTLLPTQAPLAWTVFEQRWPNLNTSVPAFNVDVNPNSALNGLGFRDVLGYTAWAEAVPATAVVWQSSAKPEIEDGARISIAGGQYEFDANSSIGSGTRIPIVQTGRIQISLLPNDGDTLTINDKTNQVVFEFDNNNAVTGGRVQVATGTSTPTCASNLVTAINAQGPLQIDAVLVSGSSMVDLTRTGSADFKTSGAWIANSDPSFRVQIVSDQPATLGNLALAVAKDDTRTVAPYPCVLLENRKVGSAGNRTVSVTRPAAGTDTVLIDEAWPAGITHGPNTLTQISSPVHSGSVAWRTPVATGALGHAFTNPASTTSNNWELGQGCWFLDHGDVLEQWVYCNTDFWSGSDMTTLGNWKGVYGQDGYSIVSDATSLPAGVTMNITGAGTYTWASSTTDGKALQKAGSPTDRVAACWYSTSSVDYNFNLGANRRGLAMYCMDYDNLHRTFKIEVFDGANQIIDSQICNDLSLTGRWYFWNLAGTIKVRLTNISGPNAVASGFFFGPVIPIPPTPPAEIQLGFWNPRSGTWNRKAYWGEKRMSDEAVRLGDVPPANTWTKLTIPVDQIGLGGTPIAGINYQIYNGQVIFDDLHRVTTNDTIKAIGLGEGSDTSAAQGWLWFPAMWFDPESDGVWGASDSLRQPYNPPDGTTVAIDDGVTNVVFEIDGNSSVGTGNVAVVRGVDAYRTMANLVEAINTRSEFQVRALYAQTVTAAVDASVISGAPSGLTIGDAFGSSVATDGLSLLAGACLDDIASITGSADSGSVVRMPFANAAGTGQRSNASNITISPRSSPYNHRYGSRVSMAQNGMLRAVSAPYDDTVLALDDRGSVYTYQTLRSDQTQPVLVAITPVTTGITDVHVGDSVVFNLVFSEPVDLYGRLRIAFNTTVGETLVLERSSQGFPTDVIRCVYTPTSGATCENLAVTAILVDGLLTDLADNRPVEDGSGGLLLPENANLDSNASWRVQTTGAWVVDVTSTNANGLYSYNQIIDLIVKFNAAVQVSGTPVLTLETGVFDGQATYVSTVPNSGDCELLFRYQVQSLHRSLDLEVVSPQAIDLSGGGIVDVATLEPANLTVPAAGRLHSLSKNKDLLVHGGIRDRLAALSPSPYDNFGWALADNGTYLAVGVPGADLIQKDALGNVIAQTNGCGVVKVFLKSGDNWLLDAEVGTDKALSESRFGAALAMAGDRLAVGAWMMDTVFVFERSGSAWNLIDSVRPLRPTTQIFNGKVLPDGFGYALAMEGDNLVVGAPWRDETYGINGRWNKSLDSDYYLIQEAGAVFRFTWNGSHYVQVQEIVHDPSRSLVSPQACRAGLGTSVGLSGNRIMAGRSGWADIQGLVDCVSTTAVAQPRLTLVNWFATDERANRPIEVTGTVLRAAGFSGAGFDPRKGSQRALGHIWCQGGVNVSQGDRVTVVDGNLISGYYMSSQWLTRQRTFEFNNSGSVDPGSQASLTTSLSGSNDDLVFTAKLNSALFNGMSLCYVNPGKPSQALSFSFYDLRITVSLATDGAGTIITKASDILNNSVFAGYQIAVSLAPGNDGTGVVRAMSPVWLTGGRDPIKAVTIGSTATDSLNNLAQAMLDLVPQNHMELWSWQNVGPMLVRLSNNGVPIQMGDYSAGCFSTWEVARPGNVPEEAYVRADPNYPLSGTEQWLDMTVGGKWQKFVFSTDPYACYEKIGPNPATWPIKAGWNLVRQSGFNANSGWGGSYGFDAYGSVFWNLNALLTQIRAAYPGIRIDFVEQVVMNDTSLVSPLNPQAPNAKDGFGWSLSAQGDRMVVGATAAMTQGLPSGAVFSFDWKVDRWEPGPIVYAELKSNSDLRFGSSVHLHPDGKRLLVGSPGDIPMESLTAPGSQSISQILEPAAMATTVVGTASTADPVAGGTATPSVLAATAVAPVQTADAQGLVKPAKASVMATSGVFLSMGQSPKGSWRDTYDPAGWWIANLANSLPSWCTLAISGANYYTWAGSTSELRALQKPSPATDRIASCAYTGGSMDFNLTITDGQTHDIGIYMLNWDSYGQRTQKVDLMDGDTLAILDTRTLVPSDFVEGMWIWYRVGGNIRLRFTQLGGQVVMQALFFDGYRSGVRFGDVLVPVTEGAGQVGIPVVRSGPTTAALTVSYATANGSALAGTDYTATSGTLSWSAGESGTKVFNVPITNRSGSQGTRSFTCSLNSPVGGILALPSSCQVEIQELRELIWMEDSTPAGAGLVGTWNWITSPRRSGMLAHQEPLANGVHQHYCQSASEVLPVGVGESLFTYVYLDPANLPTTVCLQFQDANGSWEHRAYWGTNTIPWGTDGTASRRGMGAIPAAGTDGWIRLEVPASQVALEETYLGGICFTLNNGRATFDRTGKCWASDRGMLATYFPNQNLSGAPVSRFESQINYVWTGAPLAIGMPTDGYSVRWEGGITTTAAAGNYTFTTRSMDGVRLWVNGSLLIDQWTDMAAATEYNATVALAANTAYDFRMEVFDSTGNGEARLYWKSPSMAQKQIIPPSAFTPPSHCLAMGTTTAGVLEDAGNVSLTVRRVNGSAGAASVSWTTANGTALAGTDYLASSGTVSWADGDATVKTIDVPIVNRSGDQGARSFTVTLSGAAGLPLGSPASTTVTILDGGIFVLQETLPQGSWWGIHGTEGYHVPNIGTSLPTWTGGALVWGGASSGTWAASGTTTDLRAVQDPLDPAKRVASRNFSSTSFTVTININDNQPHYIGFYCLDWVPEGFAQRIDVMDQATGQVLDSRTIANFQNGTWLFYRPSRPVVFRFTKTGNVACAISAIVFGAGSYYQLDNNQYYVAENGGQRQITVTRGGLVSGLGSVTYATTPDTALAGTDYTTTSGTLNWPLDVNGSPTKGPKTFSIPILDRAGLQGYRSFTVGLATPVGGGLTVPATATVTISDKDLFVGGDSVTRGDWIGTYGYDGYNLHTIGQSLPSYATMTINAPNNSTWYSSTTDTRALQKPPAGADRAAGLWYGSSSPVNSYFDAWITLTGSDQHEVSLCMMELSRTMLQQVQVIDPGGNVLYQNPVPVQIGPDALWLTYRLPPGKTGFRFITTQAGNGAHLSGITFGIGSCPRLSQSAYSVAENGSSVEVRVQRRGFATAGALQVDYATADGTAQAGVHYTAQSGTLSWGVGESDDKVMAIPILDNGLQDGNRTFSLALSNARGTGNLRMGTTSSATITIFDDDLPGQIQMRFVSLSVSESEGQISVPVARMGGVQGVATVQYTTVNGSAKDTDGDYTATSGTLTWAAGDGSDQMIRIPINWDNIKEGSEQFTVQLVDQSATGATLDPTLVSTAVTIRDALTPGIYVFIDGDQRESPFQKYGSSNATLGTDMFTLVTTGTAAIGLPVTFTLTPDTTIEFNLTCTSEWTPTTRVDPVLGLASVQYSEPWPPVAQPSEMDFIAIPKPKLPEESVPANETTHFKLRLGDVLTQAIYGKDLTVLTLRLGPGYTCIWDHFVIYDYSHKRKSGSVWYYQLRENAWAKQDWLYDQTGMTNDLFGHAVRLVGDQAMVGAPQADLGILPNVGRVYIYQTFYKGRIVTVRMQKNGQTVTVDVTGYQAGEVIYHGDIPLHTLDGFVPEDPKDPKEVLDSGVNGKINLDLLFNIPPSGGG